MLHFILQKASMEQTLKREAGKPFFELSAVQRSSAHIYLPEGYTLMENGMVAAPTRKRKAEDN